MTRPSRSLHPLILAPLIYVVVVGAIYLFLGTESRFSGVLLGIYPHSEITFPFSIQSVSFALWSVGVALALSIHLDISDLAGAASHKLLPQTPEKLLSKAGASGLIGSIRQIPATKRKLFDDAAVVALQQYVANGSILRGRETFFDVLNGEVDRLENKISPIRFIAWALPSLGFIGTVMGISNALNSVANLPPNVEATSMRMWLQGLVSELSVAFDTTFTALILALTVVFSIHFTQQRIQELFSEVEESFLSRIHNRLYED